MDILLCFCRSGFAGDILFWESCRGFAEDVSVRGDATMTCFAAWETLGDHAGLMPNHWTLRGLDIRQRGVQSEGGCSGWG